MNPMPKKDLLSSDIMTLFMKACGLLRSKIRIKLPSEINSLLMNGVQLDRIETTPSHLSARIDDGYLVLDRRSIAKNINIVRLEIQFIQPSDKLHIFLGSQVLNKEITGNTVSFVFLVRNKKDWSIEYIKMQLQVLTKGVINEVVLSRVDLETNEVFELLKSIATSGVSWLDRFGSLDSKTYRLDIEFKKQADPNTQIDVYINDSSLVKAQSIVFAYGTMLESLEKFYKLIGTLENAVWWVDEYIEKDSLMFLNEGINKEKVKNIRILGGPVHMNERFRQSFEAFKSDMASANISTDLKVILDDNILTYLHGRFLFDDNSMYQIPSSNIISKKFDAIVPILSNKSAQEIRNQVKKIWGTSTKYSNWKKIQQKRKSLIPNSPF